MGGWFFHLENALAQHSAIVDNDRHEPKHSSTALVGQVNVANGDGTTQYRVLNYADLGTKPTSSGNIIALSAFSSAASQLPTALNTALQVEFGALQNTGVVNISTAGLMTFMTAGQYEIIYTLNWGRTALAGIANLLATFSVNGTFPFPTDRITMDNNLSTEPAIYSRVINANAGDTASVVIYRDSGNAGVNVGGLYQYIPATSGVATSPSAHLQVYKFKGIN